MLLTETCDEELPHLITHVVTTLVPTSDSDAVAPLHAALVRKELLPRTHLVDTGYVAAKLLVNLPRVYEVALSGPTCADYHWPAQAGQGFEADSFRLDWEQQVATCHAGKISSSWTPALDHSDNEVIKIKFASVDCKPCPSRALCKTAKQQRRTITIRAQEAYAALQAARVRQESEEFKDEYRKRAGVEGAISQAVRAFGMQRARYHGLAKTHLQHLLTAAAWNLVRLNA